MKKLITTLLLIVLFAGTTLKSQPNIEWAKCYGGSQDDWASSCLPTIDGNFIIAGYTSSNDGNVTNPFGEGDAWVLKIDGVGNVLWEKCYGGSASDGAHGISPTDDDGFVLLGRSQSNDGQVSGNHGYDDFWIVKLDLVGDIEWQNSYGGSQIDYPFHIQATSTGEFVAVGFTRSNDGNVSGNHGGEDGWVIKLNNSGNLLWQKCIGGSGDEWIKSVCETTDGGFIIAGHTHSNDGNVSGNHGGMDMWIVKLNNSGDIEWQKCLGGSNSDRAYAISQTMEGGYIAVGSTASNDGNVSGNHGEKDVWIVKMDDIGDIEWQKCLGGSDYEEGFSITEIISGDYIVGGYTYSDDGNVSGNNGDADYWFFKIDAQGELLWQNCAGGSDEDYLQDFILTNDSYFLTGSTYSIDGNVSGNHGGRDIWIINLGSATGITEATLNTNYNIFPVPTRGIINVHSERFSIEYEISVYNTAGVLILSRKLSGYENEIDISRYPSGQYYIKIKDNRSEITEKVILY